MFPLRPSSSYTFVNRVALFPEDEERIEEENLSAWANEAESPQSTSSSEEESPDSISSSYSDPEGADPVSEEASSEEQDTTLNRANEPPPQQQPEPKISPEKAPLSQTIFNWKIEEGEPLRASVARRLALPPMKKTYEELRDRDLKMAQEADAEARENLLTNPRLSKQKWEEADLRRERSKVYDARRDDIANSLDETEECIHTIEWNAGKHHDQLSIPLAGKPFSAFTIFNKV